MKTVIDMIYNRIIPAAILFAGLFLYGCSPRVKPDIPEVSPVPTYTATVSVSYTRNGVPTNLNADPAYFDNTKTYEDIIPSEGHLQGKYTFATEGNTIYVYSKDGIFQFYMQRTSPDEMVHVFQYGNNPSGPVETKYYLKGTPKKVFD